MTVPGYGHRRRSGELVPLPIYHAPGQGLSIEMKVKNGPVTLLSVVQDGAGRLKPSSPGRVVPADPSHRQHNSRYRFPIGAKNFVNAWSAAGPAHHCAIGIGHLADTLEKLAALWKIECVRVC